MNSNKIILPTSESEKVEFKTSFNEDVIETLVAFSNTKGGTVYIGIADSSELKGIQSGKVAAAHWINEIKNKTAPQIIPDIDMLYIEGKEIVLISVKEYPVKPVSTRGRYFKRVGNSKDSDKVDEIASNNVTENVTEKRLKLLIELIKENNKISTTTLSRLLGVTRMTIARDIEILKNKKIIVRVGPDKGGHWEVIQ